MKKLVSYSVSGINLNQNQRKCREWFSFTPRALLQLFIYYESLLLLNISWYNCKAFVIKQGREETDGGNQMDNNVCK